MTIIPNIYEIKLAHCGVVGSKETNVMTIIPDMFVIELTFCGAVGSRETNVMARSRVCMG